MKNPFNFIINNLSNTLTNAKNGNYTILDNNGIPISELRELAENNKDIMSEDETKEIEFMIETIELESKENEKKQLEQAKSESNQSETQQQNTDIKSKDAQESNTNEENDNEKTVTEFDLEEPCNFTDPHVYHDPTIEKSIIIDKYNEAISKNSGSDTAASENVQDSTKAAAKVYPLIRIDTYVLEPEMIDYMKISYDYMNFSPYLTLRVKDINGSIKFNSPPSKNNKITVVIAPQNDNVYRKISLDFSINGLTNDQETGLIYIDGTYRFLPFKQTVQGQITYGGCRNSQGPIKCNEAQNRKPNMWETLHEICMHTGLGFASTDKVQDINDRLPRIVNGNRTWEEYIIEQILMAGVDENSVFDCWIDLYNYLVVVNLPYIFDSNISYKNLSIFAEAGVTGDDKTVPKLREKIVHRTLTNFKYLNEPSNLEFKTDSFTEIAFSSQIIGYKTEVVTQNHLSIGNGANNSVTSIDLQPAPRNDDEKNVVDWMINYVNEYVTRVDPEYNTNLQKEIVYRYYLEKRSRRYQLTLKRPNLGLQRGTLVNIAYFTQNTGEVSKITGGQITVKNSENESITVSGEEIQNTLKMANITKRDLASNGVPIPDPQKCGMYYIDGMTFEYEYNNGNGEIIQKLYLIKKGNDIIINTKNSMQKVEDIDEGDTASSNNEDSTNNTSNKDDYVVEEYSLPTY